MGRAMVRDGEHVEQIGWKRLHERVRRMDRAHGVSEAGMVDQHVDSVANAQTFPRPRVGIQPRRPNRPGERGVMPGHGQLLLQRGAGGRIAIHDNGHRAFARTDRLPNGDYRSMVWRSSTKGLSALSSRIIPRRGYSISTMT